VNIAAFCATWPAGSHGIQRSVTGPCLDLRHVRPPDIVPGGRAPRPRPDAAGPRPCGVVARAGAEVAAEALDRLCLEHIARFKRPRHYRFVDALPKNNYGKVLKTELRRLLAEPER
jgi:long-chain acyl-CoA synthetase